MANLDFDDLLGARGLTPSTFTNTVSSTLKNVNTLLLTNVVGFDSKGLMGKMLASNPFAIASEMVADGTTDNMPILRAAIAAAVAAGLNSLMIPSAAADGRYNFIHPAADINSGTPAIVLPEGFKLWSLPGVKLKIDPSSFVGVNNGRTGTFISYRSGCYIGGPLIDSQKGLVNNGNFTGYGYCFINRGDNAASDTLFENLTLVGQLSGALALECFCIQSGFQSKRQVYRNIVCRDGNGTGISINGSMEAEIRNPGTALPGDIDIIDCRAYNMKWQGITFYGARNVRLSNFKADSCGDAAIFGGQGVNMEWCDDIDIRGLEVRNCKGPGIGGFGWLKNIRLRDITLENNNQLDYNDLGEIALKRGSWYSIGFPDASNGAGPGTGDYYRKMITGCVETMYFLGGNRIRPKTTGTNKIHIHVSADPASTYPSTSSILPTEIRVSDTDCVDWIWAYDGTQIYAKNQTSNGGVWMPGTAYAVGNTRRNSGILWTVTTAGTSAATTGPQGVVGDSVTDGTVVWSATSLNPVGTESGYDIGIAAAWSRNAGMVRDEIRVNNGIAYQVTVPNTWLVTAYTSSTSNGPQATDAGVTETDGNVTWKCLGKVVFATAFVRLVDCFPPNLHFDSLAGNSGSCTRPLSDWTGTGATITSLIGAGSRSGQSVRVRATVSSSRDSASARIEDARRLEPGSYSARIRYRYNVMPDQGWHFYNRLSLGYDSGSGAGQRATQLACTLANVGSWQETEIVFSIPNGATSVPTLAYFGGSGNSAISEIDIELRVMPLRRRAWRDESWLGGRRTINSSVVPPEMNLEVGDRIQSPTGFAADQICTTSGSTGTITATFTGAQNTRNMTLSADDPAVREGMLIRIAGTNANRRVIAKQTVAGVTTAFLDGNINVAVSGATATAVLPVFVNAADTISNPSVEDGITAGAGGGRTNARQLTKLMNRVTTVATANDSVMLPAATPGTVIRVSNAGSNTLAIFPLNSSDFIGGTNGSTAVTCPSLSTRTYFCVVANRWEF